jgi:hypothetical protein
MRFDLPGGGHALFTTRAHGNLSSAGGAGAKHGREVRERLRERLGARAIQPADRAGSCASRGGGAAWPG